MTIVLYDPESRDLRLEKEKELKNLAESSQEALSVAITDKKTYEQVHNQQMILRDARIDIEKSRKDFTEDMQKRVKDAIKIEKELIAVIGPIEDALKDKKKAYDDEQERIKLEAERAKQQVIVDRTMSLAKYGVAYDWLIHAPQVMSDLVFSEIITQLEIEFKESEAKKKEQEEFDKKAREEFEITQAKLLEDQKKLEAEKMKVEQEKQEIEQKRVEEENEKKRQADEEVELASKQNYQKFLDTIGYKPEEAHIWIYRDTDSGRQFFKLIDTYK